MIFEGFREVYSKITAFWDGRNNVQSGRYATLYVYKPAPSIFRTENYFNPEAEVQCSS